MLSPRFNRKPKLGLAFLKEQGLLEATPESIAAFFHDDHRLDRAVLGDFLGDPDPHNREVRGNRGTDAAGGE